MGNTVRSFSSLGASDSTGDPEPEQANLGDALDEMDGVEPLGDFLAARSQDDDIDPVEAVRRLREDV